MAEVTLFSDPAFIRIFILSFVVNIIVSLIVGVLNIIKLWKEFGIVNELKKTDYILYKRLKK